MKTPAPKKSSPDKVRDSGFNTPSLDRALAVLGSIARSSEGLTLSQIAENLTLPVNFVYRVTQSLVSHGYALRDPAKRFRIGPQALALCGPVVNDIPLTEAALPTMRWLSEQTGEAAHVGILSGTEGIVLERVIGDAFIKFYVERGTRFPLHTSGPGKAILAFQSEPRLDEILAQLTFEQFHPWTIGSRAEYLACLEGVRGRGWATDLGEHVEGLHCLAAPIFGADGHAIASVWVTGPSHRLSEDRMQELCGRVVEAGQRISETLHPDRIFQ
jgi:IclR family acetate operon transcriptional repressor